MSYLPQAWLGYQIDAKLGGFRVRICERCPDRAAAIKEAKSSDLRIEFTTCPRCCYEQTNMRQGERAEAEVG